MTTPNLTVPDHVRAAVQTVAVAGIAARSTGSWVTTAQAENLDKSLADASAAIAVARRWLKRVSP